MVAGSAFSIQQTFNDALDELLYGVCEQLQLSDARYDLAVGRYNTLNKVLESAESPFRYFQPEIYPQGSMALGTTVQPIDGPHDLDFVLQLSRDHNTVDPMDLIETLYEFLHQNGIYCSMTTKTNRCVRIEYADEFYMDVLPACPSSAAMGDVHQGPGLFGAGVGGQQSVRLHRLVQGKDPGSEGPADS
jgi:Second Messenger Oligonucleotide or Dinucleotide Synthetase domain